MDIIHASRVEAGAPTAFAVYKVENDGGEVSDNNKPMPLNRHVLLASSAKMFCPECLGLRRVTDYFSSGVIQLECAHRRPVKLKEGHDIPVATTSRCGCQHNTPEEGLLCDLYRATASTIWSAA